jgi:hypothetical protein
LAVFQATASEMLDNLVPAAFFTTREPSLGVLPVLLFFPMVKKEKRVVVGDVEGGEVDRGVEMGKETCNSQEAPKMFNFCW